MKSDLRVLIPVAGADCLLVAAKLSHTCTEYAVPTRYGAFIIGHTRPHTSLPEWRG